MTGVYPLNKRQYVQFSKLMVMIVVLSEIAICIATIALSCCGFNMSIGVDVIEANIPFAVVVFAAYSGNSAVEKWLTRAKPDMVAPTDNTASNG